jgi:hypothetical protein
MCISNLESPREEHNRVTLPTECVLQALRHYCASRLALRVYPMQSSHEVHSYCRPSS